jgi:hypothetical protein
VNNEAIDCACASVFTAAIPNRRKAAKNSRTELSWALLVDKKSSFWLEIKWINIESFFISFRMPGASDDQSSLEASKK